MNTNKKVKVAYINVMSGFGGGEIVLQRIIKKLNKNKFYVQVYSVKTKFIETLDCPECEIFIIDEEYQLKKQRNIKALFKIIRLFLKSGIFVFKMKKDKTDIIHSNTLVSNIYFSFWAKLFRIKFVAHSHEIKEGLLFRILHKYIGFCSDKIICVSEAVKENWVKHGVSPKKLEVIYNGVDDDFF